MGLNVGIQDEESWFTAIKLSGTDRLKQAGAWYTLIDKKGKEHKFQASKWSEKLQDDNFRELVYEIMDEVNNPVHYNKGGIECIQGIQAVSTKEEFEGYLRGNIIKYVWRYRYKDNLKDLEKAKWYLNMLISEIKSK